MGKSNKESEYSIGPALAPVHDKAPSFMSTGKHVPLAGIERRRAKGWIAFARRSR